MIQTPGLARQETEAVKVVENNSKIKIRSKFFSEPKITGFNFFGCKGSRDFENFSDAKNTLLLGFDFFH